jgi:hypothetical protein
MGVDLRGVARRHSIRKVGFTAAAALVLELLLVEFDKVIG